MNIRLHKFLSHAGVTSRRGAESWMRAGRVRVNGIAADKPGWVINTETDEVTVDGERVRPQPGRAHVYIALNKPEGVITSVTDPQNRPTVLDCLPKMAARVFPVGRLDYNTSGLLLMTDDGEWANAVMHPRNGLAKTYWAKLKTIPAREALKHFRAGIIIDGRRTAPCKITIRHGKNSGDTGCRARITLREGRNRQIRKMCEAMGTPVVSLKRVSVGPVELGDLPKGQWRYLTAEEIKALRAYF